MSKTQTLIFNKTLIGIYAGCFDLMTEERRNVLHSFRLLSQKNKVTYGLMMNLKKKKKNTDNAFLHGSFGRCFSTNWPACSFETPLYHFSVNSKIELLAFDLWDCE